MKEVILCKYGEIILKGANKASFESKLLKEVKRRAYRYGNFSVRYMQSTVYVEPLDEAAEFSVRELYGTVKHVFGDREFSVPENYDIALSTQYGDYMTPVEYPSHTDFSKVQL